MRQLSVAWLLIAVLLWLPVRSQNTAGSQAGSESEGEILMTLPSAVTNWDTIVSIIPGFQGWNWPISDPCGSTNSSQWTGVSCNGYNVTRVELAGINMDGTLPPGLLLLPELEVLNLSRNALVGTLPPQWASVSLILLDLSYNKLNGPLPVAYGSKETFPKLASIFLQGNVFSGPFPGPEWTTIGFAPQVVITLRPGNDALCGPVTIIDPRFYQAIPNDQGAPQLLIPGDQSSNYSQAYLIYRGMLGSTNASPTPTTNVVITNTLGSCADPCGRTAPLITNILDATWKNNVTLADLLNYNSGILPSSPPGTLLALPCYPENLQPTYFGSDAAMLTFAGGNQLSIAGTVGAELAGGVVTSQGLNSSTLYYTGIYDYDLSGGTAKEALVQPVYWFTQLEAQFTISALSITSGDAMYSISVFIGIDKSTVFGNALAAQNLNFAPNETKVVALDNFKGNMVIIYAGFQGLNNSVPTMSLANAKVWPQEGNAAQSKPVFASSQIKDINSTTDGNLDTCTIVGPDETGVAWFGVDLGYEADVSVATLTVENMTGHAQLFVSSTEGKDQLSNATLCGTFPLLLDTPAGKRQAIECNRRGRYIGVLVENTTALTVCELEVFLETGPAVNIRPSPVSSSEVIGLAVGCTIGGIVVIGGIGFFIYSRKKRRIQEAKVGGSGGGVKRNGSSSPGNSFTNGGGSGLGPIKDSIQAITKKFLPSSPSDSTGRVSPTKLTNDSAFQSTDLSKFSDGYDIVQFSEIELVKTIGEGSFGLVWMAKYLQTTVAVKVLTHDMKRGVGLDSQERPSEAVLIALQREASIMSTLRHPNCIQYLGAVLDPPALIMEYCSKRSVDRILAEGLLDARAAKQLDWVHLLSMATDAAKGMFYLHTRSPPIIHRDLKSPNLLVDALWHVKISDFNLSRALEENAAVSSLQITNPRWLAPEVLKGAQAGKASDVYSFGVVLWELMTWELPWGHDTNPFSIINSVTGGTRLRIPSNDTLPAGRLICYDAYVDLMNLCWLVDPVQRPTMDVIVMKLRGMLTEMVQAKIDTTITNQMSGHGGASGSSESGGASGSNGEKNVYSA